ncbi:hypothetical protein Pfo_015617, partial [Paulownia fortunei]
LSRDFHSSPDTFYRSYEKYTRGFQRLAESSTPAVENPVEQPGSVEEFLAALGEEVKKGSVDTLSLALEDLAGRKNLEI